MSSAGLTVVSYFMESLDSYDIRLRESLNDVAISVVELAAEISLSKY